MTATYDRNRERRLSRRAAKQGLALVKLQQYSMERPTPRHLYQLRDASGEFVLGGVTDPFDGVIWPTGASLDDVERYLLRPQDFLKRSTQR